MRIYPNQLKEISIPEVMVISNQRKQKAYRWKKDIVILFSEDNTPKWGWLKHFSISHRERYPTWEEILACKEHFLGNIDCMMVMPKREDYVNVSKNCFHVWQTPQEWGIR